MNTFEFRETPYFTWRDDPATKNRLSPFLDMWESSNYPLPDLNLKTLTKGEAIDYLNKYLLLVHEHVNPPLLAIEV